MSGHDGSIQSPDDSGGGTGGQQPQLQYQLSPHLPRQPGNAPFQSQLQHLSSQGQQHGQQQQQYGPQSFDMGLLAGALPGHSSLTPQQYAASDPSSGLASSTMYQSTQGMYAQQRPQFADPAMLARAHQQQFMTGHYGGPGSQQNMPRQQSFPMPQQMQYSPIDPYGYGMSSPQFSPIDPRFGPQAPYLGMPAGMQDIAQFTRGGSQDIAPVPNFPRGPPRKPKQSGHALWVGNLPPQAQVVDLKDHFAKDATKDIESVFLIAKSNCAFVNYTTEAACAAAMQRFHDSRFHGVRLVCRLRRGTVPSSNINLPAEDSRQTTPDSSLSPPLVDGTDGIDDDAAGPTIARSRSDVSETSNEMPKPETRETVPEKYFIVKSLTSQDLEASVRNGIWATQSHNESALNKAYEQADNVFLIFSANKSGEYFGYARMTSAISGELVDLSKTFPSVDEAAADPAGSPQSIPTPATTTAPKGRIIDDSARGTIFWEADRSKDDSSDLLDKEGTSGQNWGKQFQIEWLSTNRLPFYRTRGLRNPLNANREVKIARDGTELDPMVGRKLIQMFHTRSPAQSFGIGVAPGVPAPGLAFR